MKAKPTATMRGGGRQNYRRGRVLRSTTGCSLSSPRRSYQALRINHGLFRVEVDDDDLVAGGFGCLDIEGKSSIWLLKADQFTSRYGITTAGMEWLISHTDLA